LGGDDHAAALDLHLAVDAADVQVVQTDVGVAAAAADRQDALVNQRGGATLVGAVDDQKTHGHERPPSGESSPVRALGPTRGRGKEGCGFGYESFSSLTGPASPVKRVFLPTGRAIVKTIFQDSRLELALTQSYYNERTLLPWGERCFMTLMSRKVDYALLILCHLHRLPAGACAREIATRFRLSRAFVANIL